MSGVSSGGGRKENGFGRIVLGEFRSKVGWEGGSLRWSRSGEPFYGGDRRGYLQPKRYEVSSEFLG